MRGPFGSWLISLHLRFVSLTSRHIYFPAHKKGDFFNQGPVIYATWHGQNFIFGFYFRKGSHPTLLVAHHGDGKMAGQVAANLGVPLVHGSGSTRRVDTAKKGGAKAFLQLLKELRRGQSVTLTADMPKQARQVGDGILLLARKSGCPIIPVAMATSRRKILRTWDRMQLNLPFSRMVFVTGEAISVTGEDNEGYRQKLHDALEEAQTRALELADNGRPKG